MFKFLIACAMLMALNAFGGECAIRDGVRDTGWVVRYPDNGQMLSCTFVGNATSINKGKLTTTIQYNQPITLEFVQVHHVTQDSFGFRITWDLGHTTMFIGMDRLRGRAFGGGKLDDSQNAFVVDEHPGYAHFHQALDARFCDCEADDSFDIRFDKSVQNVAVGLHQIEEAHLNRSFSVTLEPRRR